MLIGVGKLETSPASPPKRSRNYWESPFYPDPDEPAVMLDHPEFNYMSPWLERLSTNTGQYIDLYAESRFEGPDLAALALTVKEMRDEVASKPDSWHPNRPELPPVNFIVHKSTLLELLARWQQVIGRAQKSGRPVVCFGD